MKHTNSTTKQWKETIIALSILIVIYKLIDNVYPIWLGVQHFLGVIRPFLAGFILAYFLNGPCNYLEERTGSRGLSVLAVYALCIGILSVVISYVLPIIAVNVIEFAAQLPLYYTQMSYFVDHLDTNSLFVTLNLDVLMNHFINLFSFKEVISQIGLGLSSVGEYVVMMMAGILNVFISIIISVYLLLYKTILLKMMIRVLRIFIRERPLQVLRHYFHEGNAIFYKFIACQMLDALIVGALATLLLTVIGVRYGVTLGILIGIANMIPYFGSIFATVLTAVITIFTGGPMLALIAAGYLLILQQVDGNIIGPRLMKGALNVNPILVILAITIGGAYFGVTGMFLSIPVAAVLKMIVTDFIEGKERRLS